MPTGYTSDLYDGKDVTPYDFVYNICRAFFWNQRDAAPGTPLSSSPVPKYYYEWAEEADKKFTEFVNASEDDLRRQWSKEYADALAYWKKRTADQKALAKRYNDMITEVEAWDATGAEKIKEYALSQLRESLAFDVHFSDKPVQTPFPEWKRNTLNDLIDTRKRRQNDVKAQEERAAEGQAFYDRVMNALEELK